MCVVPFFAEYFVFREPNKLAHWPRSLQSVFVNTITQFIITAEEMQVTESMKQCFVNAECVSQMHGRAGEQCGFCVRGGAHNVDV